MLVLVPAVTATAAVQTVVGVIRGDPDLIGSGLGSEGAQLS